jgi:uncharacterized protein YjaZ
MMRLPIQLETRLIGYCYDCFDISQPLTTTNESPKTFAAHVPKLKINAYAGFLKKSDLVKNIAWNILEGEENTLWQESAKNQFLQNLPEIHSIITNALQVAQKNLPSEETHIYLFPSFSPFIAKEMTGVSGYTPYKNTLHIYIHTDFPRGWQKSLRQTITHEYAHSVYFENDFTFYKIQEAFIFEGLAEVFREEVDGTGPSPMIEGIQPKEIDTYFNEISPSYSTEDFSLYQDIFFGSKDFPQWTGYKIGYMLAKKYRNRHQQDNWVDIFNTDPNSIFEDLQK